MPKNFEDEDKEKAVKSTSEIAAIIMANKVKPLDEIMIMVEEKD